MRAVPQLCKYIFSLSLESTFECERHQFDPSLIPPKRAPCVKIIIFMGAKDTIEESEQRPVQNTL